MKEIYLAGGCFWGVEEYFSRIEGVEETMPGYANSVEESPSYERVCTGITEAAETVHIKYDESKIDLSAILNAYWKVVDPTAVNQQGADRGTQYRTGIYFTDEKDLSCIEASVAEEQKKYEKKIVTEVSVLGNFYPAEEYHRRYLKKNPGGYCHIKLD